MTDCYMKSIWNAENDFIFRGKVISPQNIVSRVEEMYKIEVLAMRDSKIMVSKKNTNFSMKFCNNQFIICFDTTFSIKEGNCALR